MMIALLVAGSFQVKKYFATLEIKHSRDLSASNVTPNARMSVPTTPQQTAVAANQPVDPNPRAQEFAREMAQQQQRQQQLEEQNRTLDEQNRRTQAEKEQATQEHQAQLDEQQRRAAEAQRQTDEARAALNAEQQRRMEEERKRASLEREKVAIYTGPLSGSLIWTGSARKGEEITIEGNRADTGEVTGGLPGLMVGVDVAPEMKGKVQIVFAPSRTNNFRLVSFRVLKGGGPMTVKIFWNRP